MSLFNVDLNIIMTFFAVLVRYSVLFSVLPFVGDKLIPAPIKIFASLVISMSLFPTLVAVGNVNPREASVWAASVGGIVGTISLEVLFGLVMGYTARLTFEGISFGANLVGNFMGYANASYYDPHQETQTQIVAQIQTSLAMLLFLALDGHHFMLRASLDSYHLVGIGKMNFGSIMSQRLIEASSQVIRYGIQIAAPISVSLFSINVAFGIMSKAIPQFNVFALSMAVTALIGLIVMFIGLPSYQDLVIEMFGKMRDWMDATMMAVGQGR
jgi:flagellar biosynthetic protein FliR